MMDFHKEELLYLARIAEQGERYDEMIQFVKDLIIGQTDMSSQERNLLSVAFKNAVGKRRSSLRIIDNYSIRDEKKNIATKKIYLSKYRMQIDTELKFLCNDAIETINNLLETIEDVENRVFLFKMKADYYRYMCEYDRGEIKDNNCDKAQEYYEKATEISKQLSQVNPIRLGLMLNFSVFYYEVKDEKDTACDMARKAFDEGLTELDNANESYYKEATMILQLFRDNLSLWT